MARDENPPFERGQTFYQGRTPDSNNLEGDQYLGKEYVFEDIDYSTAGMKATRTGHPVRCRIVRNSSAGALLPKRLVSYKAATNRQEVDGYADTTNEYCLPLDEWLPAAGVPQYDLAYVVVEGPAVCLTDLAGGANNLLPEATVLVALTAATSGATTAGRVSPADLTGATSLLATPVLNAVGRNLSAKTTGNTNADILTYVKTL